MRRVFLRVQNDSNFNGSYQYFTMYNTQLLAVFSIFPQSESGSLIPRVSSPAG